MDVLGKNGDLLLKLMSASVARHDAIASNLANQNVAGYKRQDVAFESLVLENLIRFQLWSTLIRSKSSLVESAIHGDR